MGEYRLEEEEIQIKTKLPLQSLQSMTIKEAPNEHSKLEMEVIIGEDEEKEILNKNWQGTEILVSLHKEVEECLFFGRLNKLQVMGEKGRMVVQLTADAQTILLDREKKSRSFQNPNSTYKQIIRKVMGNYSLVDFSWDGKENEKLKGPIIQYEETDWSFLQRLSSHFHRGLVGKSNGRGAMLSFGMEREKLRQLKEADLIDWGIDKSYYENGCYETGLAPGYARYLMIKTKENWNLGDYVLEERVPHVLYEKQVSFRRGELQFTYRMGMEGLIYRKKYFNRLLAGISLEGMVRKVEGELLYIQLDMDEHKGADYPWKWTPQINNISYCMPEVNTRVSLYFANAQEESGQAVLGKWNKVITSYNAVQNREFTTMSKKKLGLYPKKLFLEGNERAVWLVMEDALGIQLGSKHGVSFQAAGRIELKGRQISMVSPQEVVCKTPVSNIELCRDINIFAPSGVQTIGTGDKVKAGKRTETGSRQSPNQPYGWQAAYTALAAIPAIDLAQSQSVEYAVDLIACASIPRIGGVQTVHAMMEVMEGKKEGDCTFPHAFQSMDNYTVKGGYLLPEEEKADTKG